MQLCCTCLLLFAQQTALTHWTWHAAGAPQAQQPSGHDRPDEPHGHGSPSELCIHHLAFCDVTGGNCDGGAHPPGIAKAFVERTLPAISRVSVEAVPAISRGPPERS